MKTKIGFVCMLFSLCCYAARLEEPPQAAISNGLISANLYLPDATNGHYRATRFDWAGIFANLDCSGHSFFGDWNPGYSPKMNDAVAGPAESFSPMRYNEAKVGGTFVTIGVGVLRKRSQSPFSPFRLYDIVDGGKWTIKAKKDLIVFTHELHDSTGYAYLYTKTVRLVKGKPLMILEHSLKNTGSRVIETDVFDHNFPVIDKQPTGPAMKIIFAANMTATGAGWGTVAKIEGRELTFLKDMTWRDQLKCDSLQGFGQDIKDYDFKIQNQKTGAGIRVTADQPLEKVVFWANPNTACPEPYIKIKVLPGETLKWNISYEFYTLGRVKNQEIKSQEPR
jgi:hypothetical protein